MDSPRERLLSESNCRHFKIAENELIKETLELLKLKMFESDEGKCFATDWVS